MDKNVNRKCSTVSDARAGEFAQALLEGSRYFVKQLDVLRLKSPASRSVVPELRYCWIANQLPIDR